MRRGRKILELESNLESKNNRVLVTVKIKRIEEANAWVMLSDFLIMLEAAGGAPPKAKAPVRIP